MTYKNHSCRYERTRRRDDRQLLLVTAGKKARRYGSLQMLISRRPYSVCWFQVSIFALTNQVVCTLRRNSLGCRFEHSLQQRPVCMRFILFVALKCPVWGKEAELKHDSQDWTKPHLTSQRWAPAEWRRVFQTVSSVSWNIPSSSHRSNIRSLFLLVRFCISEL